MSGSNGNIIRRWPVAAATLAGCCFAGPWALVGMNVWIRVRMRPYLHARADGVPRRSVAIVPGARVRRDGAPSPALEDRLAAALTLYQSGKVGQILVSGDHSAPEFDEPEAMRRWLLRRDVPPADLLVDRAGFRTLDTMQRARRVFDVEEATICTQAFHLARAVLLARAAGIDALGLVADRRTDRYAAARSAREFFARSRAFVDVYILDTGPRQTEP